MSGSRHCRRPAAASGSALRPPARPLLLCWPLARPTSVAHIWRIAVGQCSAEKGGQFAKKEIVNQNPRYLSGDEVDDAIRGFQQLTHVRNQGMIDLLHRWTLNVDVLHGLSRDQRDELVEHLEVVTVKPGAEIVS